MAMMSVVEDIADPKELAQKKLDVLGLVIFPTAVFHGLQKLFHHLQPGNFNRLESMLVCGFCSGKHFPWGPVRYR